jgi:hypothetical protein
MSSPDALLARLLTGATAGVPATCAKAGALTTAAARSHIEMRLVPDKTLLLESVEAVLTKKFDQRKICFTFKEESFYVARAAGDPNERNENHK